MTESGVLSGDQKAPDGDDGTPRLLAVRDLTVRTGAGARTIVSGLDLDLDPRKTVGIVGESGSGKSLTARAIAGLLAPGLRASGSVSYRGRELLTLTERERARFRGADIGMILQDPFTMLNPLMRVGDQVLESLRMRAGRPRGTAARIEAARRLAEVGIHDPTVADRFPFQLSGGMRQRVAIAAALAGDPRLLIADEPTTALDVTTQREILDLLRSLQVSRGMALVLITHDLRVAFSVCDSVVVLYAGRAVEQGTAAQLHGAPRHPYTLGLLMSEPDVAVRVARLAGIPGNVPGADEVAGTCAFATRCDWVQDPCRSARPPLRTLDDGRSTACVRIDGIAGEMDRARGTRRVAEAGPQHREHPPLLTVHEVSKRFHTGRGHVVEAVRGVSLTVGAGEAVGVVGESGSGKTTLARCIMGLERISAGHVELAGVDADEPDRRARTRLVRLRQMVFQDPYSSLNPRRTIGSTLAEVAVRASPPPPDVRAAVTVALERVGLPAAYAGRRPRSLSGGERQRVAIARALALKPALLVCDEPVSALDVSVQAQILNLLNDLRAELGIAVLFVSHDLAVVRQVVDRVYVMHRGEVVESGPVDDVLDRPQHEYTRRLVDAIPRP